MILRFVLMLILIALAACSSDGEATPTPTPVTPIKLLATVYIVPTPNAGEREATRLAQPVNTPTAIPTQPPAATVYVGTFLGAADTGAP